MVSRRPRRSPRKATPSTTLTSGLMQSSRLVSRILPAPTAVMNVSQLTATRIALAHGNRSRRHDRTTTARPPQPRETVTSSATNGTDHAMRCASTSNGGTSRTALTYTGTKPQKANAAIEYRRPARRTAGSDRPAAVSRTSGCSGSDSRRRTRSGRSGGTSPSPRRRRGS